jgi:hypothetical protein
MREVMKLVLFVCLAAVYCGCTTVRESTPARTATEQLLLSTATEHALADQRFPWLEGKKTFVEDKYFESYDKGNAVGAIRERLAASGALLVKTQEQADLVVEIRSPVLSMDNSDTLLGVPALSLPILLTGIPLQTPEVALYKSKKSNALAKFALFVYERDSGQYLRSVNPMLGRADLRVYKIVVISWQKTDVPELSPKHKQKAGKANAKPPPS